MAEVKEVTVKINVDDGDVKKTTKDFNTLNKEVTTGSKQMTTSLNTMSGSLLKVGAALGGAFAIKAVVGDAVQRVIAFEKAMSSLSAITGVTGTGLDNLQKRVLQVSKNTKKSAIEIAKAFELVGSKAPQLLENSAALAKVTEEAITLSKASGEDLVQSASALTGVMNQFNLEASDSERIINALAAGSQKGAAPVADIAAAIDKFGTVAEAANISVENSIGLVETLAEKNINGAEAGTQLRNIILKLQAANIGFTDGVFNLNDALEEVKDKNLSAAESAKLFGLESVTAGNILVNGTDTINTYTDAVTGTNTAYDQAIIQTDNLATKTEELDATYETFILSLEDGTGSLSEFSKEVVDTAINLLTFITNLNDGKGALASFQELIADNIQTQGGLEEQSKALGISQKNLALAFQNNGDVLTVLSNKFGEGEITLEQYRTLVNQLAEGNKEAEDNMDGLTGATEENTEATEKNVTAKKKQLDFFERMDKAVTEAKERIKQQDTLSSLFAGEDKTEAELTEEATAEDEDFLKAVGLDDASLEKDKEARKKKAENKAEQDAEDLEAQIEQDELVLEWEQEMADRRGEVNEQVAFSALNLASALASAAGDSQEAQAAALAFDKIAAVAGVVVNTAKTNAIIVGEGAALAIPTAGASVATAAGLVATNNAVAALNIATILATAIPQIKQIQSSGKEKNLKDGEIRIQGAGTRTSDSIKANLSVDESVIKAKQSIKHEAALKAINDDRFDEYLNRVVMQQLYMGGGKKDIRLKTPKSKNIQFPSGMNINNARTMAKMFAEEMNNGYVNLNGKWE